MQWLHGDIKLNNWGVEWKPFSEVANSLQLNSKLMNLQTQPNLSCLVPKLILMDFGKALPLSSSSSSDSELIAYTGLYSLPEMTCPLMRASLPWHVHVDYFCVAHCLLSLLHASEREWKEEVEMKSAQSSSSSSFSCFRLWRELTDNCPHLLVFEGHMRTVHSIQEREKETLVSREPALRLRRYRARELWSWLLTLLISWVSLTHRLPLAVLGKVLWSWLVIEKGGEAEREEGLALLLDEELCKLIAKYRPVH